MTTIRKFTIAFLYVAILSQLTILTSCKDDDKLTEEEKQQKQEQEADEQFLLTSDFWQVVGQLSTAEVLPDDWQNATFEPGIGQASDKSTTTRIVLTNEAEAAAESFEELTGTDVSNSDIYEWKRDFGTLTYKKSHDGLSWATVDVDIKQMPGLKRIVYCTPDQQGLNANVPGTPYYRFGDVVKKRRDDGIWEYWVCVRPCFGPEQKGDMHWMCLGNLPYSNIETYTYNGEEWWRYKNLTTKEEHIKNLSELTFAILHPVEWSYYYQNNQKKCHFHDFRFKNINYHNEKFWKKVQYAWNVKLKSEEDKTIFELLFHRTLEDMQNDRQLNFFTGSASGPSWRTWFMKMQTLTVDHNKVNDTYKFRELIKQNHNKSCEGKAFDIRDYSTTGKAITSTYFDQKDLYIYPLRYATGKQLFEAQPGNYQPMDGSNGIVDVYVYNKFYNQPIGADKMMEEFKPSKKTPFTGRGIFFQGDVVGDINGNTWICVQDAKNNIFPSYTSDYAYFISFDKNALGATPVNGPIYDFKNLPSRNLAIQILWVLETMTHNCALATTNNTNSSGYSWAYEQIKNIKSYAGFDMMLLYPYRDSVHAYNNAPEDFIPIPCSFSNALYRTDDNKIGIVRVIGDYTVSQGPSGGRDCSWRIYDCYTKDLETNPRKMLLNDLSDDDMVKHYCYDRWANLEWKIFETDVDGGIVWDSRGLRRTLLTTKDLSVWLRANQPRLAFINPDVPVKNMYNEPVMAFAVKRVLDKPGIYPDYKFEDGTTFLPISLLKDVNDVFFDNSMSPVFIPTFDRYNTHSIFVNDVQDSSFGLCNTK